MKDYRGDDIQVGDVLLYAMPERSSAALATYRVLEIQEPDPLVSWDNGAVVCEPVEKLRKWRGDRPAVLLRPSRRAIIWERK